MAEQQEKKIEDVKRTDDYIIDESRVEFSEEIGRGHFSKVYRGKLFGRFSCEFIIIAIKQILLKYRQSLLDLNTGIEKEMRLFIRLNHVNVARMIGMVKRVDSVSLILMEIAEGGCLHTYLDSDTQIYLPIIRWALQIVSGMNYLHENDLLHCDLKPKNILLDFVPKSSEDCKRVVLKMANISHFTHISTASYMSPEAMKNKISKKSDVWSFGVILWEMVHWERPFRGLESMQIIYKVGIKKEILPISKDCHPALMKLMRSCMSYDENDRPNFSELKQELDRIGDI